MTHIAPIAKSGLFKSGRLTSALLKDGAIWPLALLIAAPLALAACGTDDATDDALTETQIGDVDTVEGTISDGLPDFDTMANPVEESVTPDPASTPQSSANSGSSNAGADGATSAAPTDDEAIGAATGSE